VPLYDRGVHLRRALLLFAIVLGLAALATTVSRPVQRADRPEQSTQAEPVPSEPAVPGSPMALRFEASRPRRRGLPAGQAAEVLVSVDSPGLVEIPRLGLSAAADPVTPARFDVLATDPGRYPILFSPAAGDEVTDAEPAGTLVVKQAVGPT
jgi:hypothetical protein